MTSVNCAQLDSDWISQCFVQWVLNTSKVYTSITPLYPVEAPISVLCHCVILTLSTSVKNLAPIPGDLLIIIGR